MKILFHVITNFSGVGGAEMMLVKLIKSSPHSKHVIVSLIDVSDFYKSMLTENNVTFYSFNCKNFFDLFFCFIRLKRIIINHASDKVVVLAWMYHACFVGGLFKIFNSNTLVFFNIRHSLDDLKGESMSTKVAIKASRTLSKYIDGCIFCSKRSLIQHSAYGYKCTLSYIPNGIKLNQNRRVIRRKKNIKRVIGTLGRFHDAKDYPNLLKAFRVVLNKFPETVLYIAGNGATNENPIFKSLTVENNIPSENLMLFGEIKNISSYFSQLDLFILASKTEGFPNVLIEAMNEFLPVISTDSGDASYIIPDKKMIVPPQNSFMLAESIMKTLSLSDTVLDEIGNRNHSQVRKKFSMEKVSLMYNNLLFSDEN